MLEDTRLVSEGRGTSIIQIPWEEKAGAQGCRRHGLCLETSHLPSLILPTVESRALGTP